MASKKSLLANDPLGGSSSPSVMDSILERNRERHGRPSPEISSPIPSVEPTEEPLRASVQPRNRARTHATEHARVEIKPEPPAENPSPSAPASDKNQEAVSSSKEEADSTTIRDRAVELASSVRIPPTTLNTRIPEALGDRLDELTLKFKKQGVSKQSLTIALLERGLLELEREEGWRR